MYNVKKPSFREILYVYKAQFRTRDTFFSQLAEKEADSLLLSV